MIAVLRTGGQLCVAVGHAGDEHISIALKAWGADWNRESQVFGGGKLKVLCRDPLELRIEGSSVSIGDCAIPIFLESTILKNLEPLVKEAIAVKS